MIQRIPVPESDEYASFYQRYVQLARDAGADALLADQDGRLHALCDALSDQDARARYAPGKWSVKEVLGHLADTERVFAYRVLRISRGDATPLASFDENLFVAAAAFDRRPLAALLADFDAVRAATRSLLDALEPEQWERRGVASGHEVSVRALVHIITGHVEHHVEILRERYGLGAPLPETPVG